MFCTFLQRYCRKYTAAAVVLVVLQQDYGLAGTHTHMCTTCRLQMFRMYIQANMHCTVYAVAIKRAGLYRQHHSLLVIRGCTPVSRRA